MAGNKEGFISRIQERVGVNRELSREAERIESLVRQRNLPKGVQQRIKDVLTVSRSLKSDKDPDIPVLLRAIYQLRGIFNPNLNVSIGGIAPLSPAQRNAERVRLMQMLEAGNLSRSDFEAILERADELDAME